MRTIWKYEFPIQDEFTLSMKEGAEIIHVESQHGVPCLWALVDTGAPMDVRLFAVAGTGHPAGFIQEQHVGTFFMRSGNLVWHLFELEM